MKKEISLREVIETLSAHDNRAEDARLISIDLAYQIANLPEREDVE